ncbi:nucleotidyltransferase domain-containing protein (plasmid) [Bacillus albus]|uniref:nucleotidyltransferase domain-containing protein n=1 Tax=Bacillus cereus group TaxID=86661 RepID=UPI0022E1498A|nr:MULTISPECIES: nucleotidyltransferase domain-containing protein [Bacillus cereus group]MDA2029522.1 nucleotidyltransferase domain-containing protein [Bacillus cereus group sp. Bcc03]MDA2219124.1 nucleotidyltransferase domain-containing protein [Bacillus cereus group sp. Bc228]MDA2230743.1 nucleotidyltransferase domain-containing protein [Bacillus cereus group sp. Bc227]MDA2263412.1 nucleotidyltransferase domain-containing protein [Bacillus cereus group sp. Bc200]MDA2716224.1 nucleotidyltrans
MYNILKRQYNYFIRGVIRINKEIQRELDLLVQKIRETVSSVQKIILFGSHAYGTPNEDSDFDLCIVVEGVGERKREVINLINWGIYDVMETPVDILVYGPEEFQERASRTVTMEHKIALEGKVLYEVRDVLE